VVESDDDLSGRRLGEFVLLERLGGGGHGTAYRAEQPLLGREVVVKVMRRRLRGDSAAIQRFSREARLASRLDSAYAAHVHAFGVENDGLFWIAMELVHGITLERWLLERGPLPLELLVPFVERIAEAVQEAHVRGIVHRDIKPANIMITVAAGGLVPKLLDFGIAKSLGDRVAAVNADVDATPLALPSARALRARRPSAPARLTRTGTTLGTPAYMAPEQWENQAGPASDIYALGVIVYEALTGRRPFAAPTAEELGHLHHYADVPPLGDPYASSLDAIIARALAKRPEDRFGTAPDLADALRLELLRQPGELVQRSSKTWEARGRPEDMLMRDRTLDETLASLPAAVALGATEAEYLAASQRAADRRARNRRLVAVLGIAAGLALLEYRSKLKDDLLTQAEKEQGQADLLLLGGNAEKARAHLDKAWQRGDHSFEVEFMFARALQPRRAELARLPSSSDRAWSAQFSPDGGRIVTTDDKAVRLWDGTTYQLLFTLPHGDIVYQAVFSPDGGTQFASASNDGAVRIWDAARGALVRELRRPRAGGEPWHYNVVAWSGRVIAAIERSGSVAHVWDSSTGAQLAELPNDGTELASLAFSADGRWLATSGGDDVRVFDTATWAQVVTIAGPHVQCLAFDSRGPHLAIGTEGGDAAIWDIPSGARTRHLHEVGEPIDRLAFAPNGELVATASRDGAVQVWDAGSGRLRSQSNTIKGKVYSIEFDASSTRVLASGGDGTVVVSDAQSGVTSASLDGTPAKLIRSAHFDPASQRIIGASWDGTARVWNAAPAYAVEAKGSPPPQTSSDGRRRVVLPTDDGPPELWDVGSNTIVARLEGHVGRVWAAHLAHGAKIVSAGADGTARLWDASTGKLLQTFEPVGAPRFLADAALNDSGSLLVAGAGDGSLKFWDVESGREIWTLQVHKSAVVRVAFDDGAIVTQGQAGDVARWVLPDPALVIGACAGQPSCGTVRAP